LRLSLQKLGSAAEATANGNELWHRPATKQAMATAIINNRQ